jgi:hypothetical protein
MTTVAQSRQKPVDHSGIGGWSSLCRARTARRLVHLAWKKHRVKKNGMSAATFARLYRSRAPMDVDTAKETSANLAVTDQAK